MKAKFYIQNVHSILIVITGLLASCVFFTVPCGQHHTMEDKFKINYNLHDRLAFINSDGHLKKYKITLKDSSTYKHTQTGENEGTCQAYYEFENIAVCSIYDSTCFSPYYSESYSCIECLS